MSADPCSQCNEPWHDIEDGVCGRCYWWFVWPKSFMTACTIACQNGDDDIKRQRLYNELREIGMV